MAQAALTGSKLRKKTARHAATYRPVRRNLAKALVKAGVMPAGEPIPDGQRKFHLMWPTQRHPYDFPKFNNVSEMTRRIGHFRAAERPSGITFRNKEQWRAEKAARSKAIGAKRDALAEEHASQREFKLLQLREAQAKAAAEAAAQAEIDRKMEAARRRREQRAAKKARDAQL